MGRTPDDLTVCVHLLRGVRGKAGLQHFNSWLFSYGYRDSPPLCHCIFQHTHTQLAGGGGWAVVCAGSVLGMQIPGQVFLLTCLPWAYQVIPLWISCLFKQVCVEGVGSVEKKKCNFFALVELWESFNILDLLKDFLLKLPPLFGWIKKFKSFDFFKRPEVLWRAWKI